MGPNNNFHFRQKDTSFRACKAITDLILGVRYQRVCGNCNLLTVGLDYEHHLFFAQNQLRNLSPGIAGKSGNPAGLTGFNMDRFTQSNRGDLSIQGWTLALRLDF